MTQKSQLEKYVRKAVELGAVDAKVIPADSVVTAAWVRIKCQFGCGGYGQCLTCPPHSPTPEKTAEILSCYRKAILLHGDDHSDMTEIAVAIERQVFLDGHYKAFAMGAGPCQLCGECNIANNECRNPEKARPAMEACGIDVFQTARNNGYQIDVVKNHSSKQNYFALVLVE
jgi:predicted metal-binding protein